MIFNVNDHVRVRLTDAGREFHRRRHAQLCGDDPRFPYTPPKEDGGWSRWQLHHLMATFGPGISMIGPALFETKIDISDSSDVPASVENPHGI